MQPTLPANSKTHAISMARTTPRATMAIWILLAGNCAYGQFNLPKPETPLLGAAASGNAAAVKQLLQAGANPNEGQLLGLPAVMFPLMMQNREMFQAFVDANADLQVRDKSGATTLMWAVYHENASPEVIQQVLKAGVDPNARDARGDTALVWAMRRGNAPAVHILEQAGASRDPQIREAVQKSLALLQKSSPQFVRISGCISCHHQSLPTMAMAIARQRGIAFNEPEAAKDVEAVVAMWRNVREYMTMDAHQIPNPPIVASYSLVSLAAAKYPADETTGAMARFIAQYQKTDGSWRSDIKRPPLEASDITATALSLRSLQLYAKDEKRVARGPNGWRARNRAPPRNKLCNCWGFPGLSPAARLWSGARGNSWRNSSQGEAGPSWPRPRRMPMPPARLWLRCTPPAF